MNTSKTAILAAMRDVAQKREDLIRDGLTLAAGSPHMFIASDMRCTVHPSGVEEYTCRGTPFLEFYPLEVTQTRSSDGAVTVTFGVKYRHLTEGS